MEVVTSKLNGPSITVEYDLGTSLDDLAERFTPEVVASHARRSIVIALQAYVRQQMDADKPEDEIKQMVSEWKPGQRKPGKSQSEKVHDMLAKMDPATREALLKEYKPSKKRDQEAA